MKKWMFVIAPVAMFCVFLFFYEQKMSEMNAREQARAEAAAKVKAEDQAKKDASEEKARLDAEKRAADQAAEEKAAEAKRVSDYKALMAEIQAGIDTANKQIAEYTKQGDALQAELTALQKRREQDTEEEFALSKNLEDARINQRDAELEIQRMVDMIAQKADQSAMARPPPPPPSK